MAGKKPFAFTAVGCVADRSGDGRTRVREKIVFEQIHSPPGTCRFRTAGRARSMPEAEQAGLDRRMMEQVGKNLSENRLKF